MLLLEHIGVDPKGMDAAIIGASNHVGRPMGLELLLAGATVTTAHKFTRNIADKVRLADIVISAVNRDWYLRSGSSRARLLSTSASPEGKETSCMVTFSSMPLARWHPGSLRCPAALAQ